MNPTDLPLHHVEMKDIVKKYLKLSGDENEFTIRKTDIRYASDGLLGFQAEYFRMTTDVEIEGKLKQLYFFIKSLSEVAQEDDVKINFGTEIETYRFILPELEKVLKNISCITPSLLVTDNILVFEDLAIKGYKVKNSREYFDKEHCIVALRSLAELHASSIIYEETKKIELNNKKFNLADKYDTILRKCVWKFEGWYYIGMKAALAAAGESKQYGKDTKYFEEVKSKWPQFFEEALQQTVPSKERRSVISHMDLWSHNIMFNYDNNNPVHCIFIDFQSVIYMPIHADVVTLLYLNLSREQRNLLYNDLILYYYNELEKQLSHNGIKLTSITTWEIFVKDCETFKKFALAQSAILQQITLWEPKIAKSLLENETDYHSIMNISRDHIILDLIKTDPLFKNRYMELIDDLIETFIIEKRNQY